MMKLKLSQMYINQIVVFIKKKKKIKASKLSTAYSLKHVALQVMNYLCHRERWNVCVSARIHIPGNTKRIAGLQFV